MKLKRARVRTVAAQRRQHLPAELGEHGGVVFSVYEDGLAIGAHASFDVGYGAYGSPVVTEFFHADMVAKAFPDVVGGHALADNVGEIGGKVEEASGFDSRIVHQRDVADGRAEAGAEDPQPGVPLLLEPTEAAAGVLDGLAVGLESQPNIGPAD